MAIRRRITQVWESGRLDRRTFAALIAGMLSVSTGVGFIVPLLPLYAQTLGATGLWVGLIFGANPFMRGIFELVFGRLADVRGMKKFMTVGLAGYALVALGFLSARSPWQLFAWRLLQGFFGSMVEPVARAYAGSLTPQGQEGRVMSFYSLAFFAGFAIGPPLGGLLGQWMGPSAPFYGMTVLSAVALLMVILYVPEKAGTAARGGQALVPLSAIGRDRTIQGLIWGRSFLAQGRGIFTGLLPLWVGAVGLSPFTAGALISVRSVVESVMQPLFGALSDRYDRRRLALCGYALAPVAFLLTPWAVTTWRLTLVCIVLALSSGVSVPAITALTVDKGRSVGMGSIMGVTGTAMSLGMALGSLLGGIAMDWAGIEASFRAGGWLSLLGMLGFGYLTRQSAPAPVPARSD